MGQHSCFRKKKSEFSKLDKLVVEKFPVVANFHDVIKSCRESSVILFTLSVRN